MSLTIRLQTIRELQDIYPSLHVGGSIGLMLHGIRLNRFGDFSESDIDLCSSEEIDFAKMTTLTDDIIPSGNDFDSCFTMDGYKIDFLVDETQKMTVVSYMGFDYRVTSIFTILKFKSEYAAKGVLKHQRDILEMIGLIDSPNYLTIKESVDDLPF